MPGEMVALRYVCSLEATKVLRYIELRSMRDLLCRSEPLRGRPGVIEHGDSRTQRVRTRIQAHRIADGRLKGAGAREPLKSRCVLAIPQVREAMRLTGEGKLVARF